MKKIIAIHTVVLLVLIAAGAYAYFRFWNVAVVNGVPISRVSFYKTLEKQGGQEVLASMIDNALVLKEGKDKGVNIDQKTIDDELAKIEEQLKVQNQSLDSALAAAGMTKNELAEQIRIRKIETILSATKVDITQSQIDEFLEANKSFLPTDKTKEELQTLAKEQLAMEASQSATENWLNNLRQSAKIQYK
jgi:hypothetical protein